MIKIINYLKTIWREGSIDTMKLIELDLLQEQFNLEARAITLLGFPLYLTFYLDDRRILICFGNSFKIENNYKDRKLEERLKEIYGRREF